MCLIKRLRQSLQDPPTSQFSASSSSHSYAPDSRVKSPPQPITLTLHSSLESSPAESDTQPPPYSPYPSSQTPPQTRSAAVEFLADPQQDIHIHQAPRQQSMPQPSSSYRQEPLPYTQPQRIEQGCYPIGYGLSRRRRDWRCKNRRLGRQARRNVGDGPLSMIIGEATRAGQEHAGKVR